MSLPFIRHYWGKARPLAGAKHDWHPIAYHGLDVAAAGDAYLDLRRDILQRLARRTGLTERETKTWLLFALAVHDLGKFADCFQVKWQRIVASPWQPGPDPGHGAVGRALWAQQCELIGEDAGFGDLFEPARTNKTRFRPWVDAVFGHHGRPVGAPKAPLAQLMTDEAAADARAFVLACATLFPLTAQWITLQPGDRPFQETSWLVAGTAMIADWIGSNQAWFPYEAPEQDLASYWETARK